MTENHIVPDGNGEIRAPEAPGLGMAVDARALAPYLVDVEIKVGGQTLFSSSHHALSPS